MRAEPASAADVCAETMISERQGMLRALAKNRAGVAVAVRMGRMTQETADAVNRAVAAFAEGCAIGLHVEGETPAVVREALRPMVREMGNG